MTVCVCFSEKIRMLLGNLWACVEPQEQHSANLLHLSGEASSSPFVYLCSTTDNSQQVSLLLNNISDFLFSLYFFHHFTFPHACKRLFFYFCNFRVHFQASSTVLSKKQTALSSELHFPVCFSQDQ